MGKRYLLFAKRFWEEVPSGLKIILVLSAIITIGFIGVGVTYNSVFTYDQARDALQAYSIWHDHNIKILGPETDIPGVFHGVLWYYLLAVFYAIGRIPEFVIAAFSILTACTIVLVGILAQRLFQNVRITILAMVFYMLSPLFQTTSRWVSNPLLAFLLTPLLLLLLWEFFKKRSSWLALFIGICFGVIIQGEFAFVLLLVALPIYWILLKFAYNLKDIASFFIGLLITISSFILAEVKFKGQGIKGIIQFFSSSHTAHQGALTTISYMWGRVIDLFGISVFPFHKIFIGILLCLFILFLVKQMTTKNKKPLLFLLGSFSSLFVFLFFHTGISTSYFLFYPFFIPVILLISVAINTFYTKKILFIIVVVIIMIGEIYSSYTFLETNTSPLPAQQGATLSLAEKVISYSYESSSGKPFTIITITNPLFINTTWAYLYTTYGLPRYGYVPNFAGRNQVGRLGYLPEKQFATIDRYLIIEPPIGIPSFYIKEITHEEDMISYIVSEKHFGNYVLQKRRLRLERH